MLKTYILVLNTLIGTTQQGEPLLQIKELEKVRDLTEVQCQRKLEHWQNTRERNNKVIFVYKNSDEIIEKWEPRCAPQ
jgi:hypothetical protein